MGGRGEVGGSNSVRTRKSDFKYYFSPQKTPERIRGGKECPEQLVSELRSSGRGVLLVSFVPWDSSLPRQARLEAQEL